MCVKVKCMEKSCKYNVSSFCTTKEIKIDYFGGHMVCVTLKEND